MKFDTEIFSQFNDKWALLCAGTPDSFNAMTISWGGMGTLWFKPVVTVYVRPDRYTYQFMEKSDYFTISFYPEANRRDLTTMGSLSGRDGDKLARTGLTAKAVGNAVTFEQAEITLLCQKIYHQDMAAENMDANIAEEYYSDAQPHRMYIGEVMEIIRK